MFCLIQLKALPGNTVSHVPCSSSLSCCTPCGCTGCLIVDWLTFSVQWQGIRHGSRHQCVRSNSLLLRTQKARLLSRPVALRGHCTLAWRPTSIARKACQGGSFHARRSFCGAGAPAANAQPAALWVMA